MATLASLLVVMGMDTTGLTAGIAKAETSLAGMGASAGRLGALLPTIGAAAGVAFGVAAVASVKAAMDFDNAFTRIAAISNASAKDIQAWKGEVLDLAGETAKAPKELADALFFLSSAGLDAKQVMPALTASAKAAASGLGETADVANIVASALNAYSDSGLTAAKVTDVLVAAVREGRAEPDEFAAALGRILPIAAAVGVTFDQVAGSMAVLSNIGLDVDEAVTAMRGTLQAIAAPGTAAADAMKKLGLSAQDLLDAISEDGIIGALRLLDVAAKEQTNTQAAYFGILSKVVPNVRALTGVLGLTGQAAEKVNAIFDNVADSTGDTDRAFGTTAKGSAFQIKKALNDIAIAGQKIATDLLPVLAEFLGVLAEIADIATAPFEAPIIDPIDPKLVATATEYRNALSDLADAYLAGRIGQTGLSEGMLEISERLHVNIGIVDQAIDKILALSDSQDGAARSAEAGADAAQKLHAGLGGLPPVLDDVAKGAHKAGRAAERFAGMGKKAFAEFQKGIVDSVQVSIGQFDKLSDAFTTTPAELARQAHLAVQIARRMHQDLKEIFASKDLTDAQKAALASLPADQRDAWARGGVEVKRQITKDAMELNRLNNQNAKQITGGMGEILHKGGSEAGRQLGAGASQGITAGGGVARAAAARLGHQIVEDLNNAMGIQSPSTEGIKAGQSLVDGIVKGMLNHQEQLLKAAEKLMSALQDKLSNLVSKAQSFGQGISGGFSSLLGFPTELPEGQDIQGFFQQQLHAAETFASVLKALQAQGAGKGLLGEIASQGVAGIPMAQQLLQGGPEAVAAVNAAYNDIAKIAETTADSLTNVFFGDRIDALRKDVKDQKDVLVDIKHNVKFLEKIANQLGDGAQHITVNINGDVTGEEIVRKVRDGLLKVGNRNAGTGL